MMSKRLGDSPRAVNRGSRIAEKRAMRRFSSKPAAWLAAFACRAAIIVCLLASVEAAAQEPMLRPPLVKESQKTDRTEQLREELVALDELIKREPQNIAAYEMRASHYFELKEYEKLIADHSRIIALKPDAAKSYLSRAHGYRELRQYDKALADLARVIRIEPRNYDAYDAYLDRYLIYYRLKAYEKAIAALTAILRFKPDDEAIYQIRVGIYRETKQYDKAVADYTRIIKLKPRLSYGYHGRAEVYKIIGQPQKAAADLRAAEKIDKARGF